MPKLLHLFISFNGMFSADLTTTHTFTLGRSLLKYHISINTILSWPFHQSKATFLYIPYSAPFIQSPASSTALTLHLTLLFICLLFLSPSRTKLCPIYRCMHSTKTRGCLSQSHQYDNCLAAKVSSCIYLQLLVGWIPSLHMSLKSTLLFLPI